MKNTLFSNEAAVTENKAGSRGKHLLQGRSNHRRHLCLTEQDCPRVARAGGERRTGPVAGLQRGLPRRTFSSLFPSPPIRISSRVNRSFPSRAGADRSSASGGLPALPRACRRCPGPPQLAHGTIYFHTFQHIGRCALGQPSEGGGGSRPGKASWNRNLQNRRSGSRPMPGGVRPRFAAEFG